MALRLLFCLLVAAAVCSAMRGDERQFRGRQLPHGRRPGLSPLRRFIRKCTHDSLDLDILITPGLDPCHLNNTKIVKRVPGKKERVIGELTDSMIFGLRGFDDFRQKFNIQKRIVLTTLAFELLEGAGKVTLRKNKKQFQLNMVAEMLLVIKSKLHFDDHHVSFSDSFLRRSLEPVIRLFPSQPVSHRLLKKIGRAFIIQAEHCIRRKFIPAFEAGVNRALVAKNITEVIENLRRETSEIHKKFHNATKTASEHVVEYMENLKLPNIELIRPNGNTRNLTDGRVIDMSKPKLYFYNADDKKDTYNLQLLIRKLVITYAMNDRSLPYDFSHIQFLLQVKQVSKRSKPQVLKGIVIGVEIPHPPKSLPLLQQINSKLYALLMNFLEPQLKIAFIKALKM